MRRRPMTPTCWPDAPTRSPPRRAASSKLLCSSCRPGFVPSSHWPNAGQQPRRSEAYKCFSPPRRLLNRSVTMQSSPLFFFSTPL
ncbi:hypothetical protein PAHAL_1G151700 [Panicum hallii]|uniref:Uncharacterized protein n=1 Tax=Panicum hallii TaxID=206008 RepID=A0A2T8KVA1_9POAL|nr:hypothetical protein PAHAL_1G151700 [Panicum hallii]